MGLFDSLFKPDTSATTQAYNAQQKDINTGSHDAMINLKRGLTQGSVPLNQAADIYGQFGQQFQPGIGMYLNSLGLNGPEGNTAAVNAFQTGPGYDFALNQGLEAVKRNQASLGGLLSGGTLQGLNDYAFGKANQEYGNWQDRLAGLINPAYQGMSGKAQTLKSLSDLISGNYENRANVNLGTATNLANLAGQYGQNMQGADTAGTENFWNAILGGLNAAGKVAGAFA